MFWKILVELTLINVEIWISFNWTIFDICCSYLNWYEILSFDKFDLTQIWLSSYIKIRGKNSLYICPQMVKMYNWPIECVCWRVNRRKENILPLCFTQLTQLIHNATSPNTKRRKPKHVRDTLTAGHDLAWYMSAVRFLGARATQ